MADKESYKLPPSELWGKLAKLAMALLSVKIVSFAVLIILLIFFKI